MNDFFQMLKEAFPVLKSHPRVVLAAFLILAALVAIYSAKELRARICKPCASKMYQRVFSTQRWLYVYKPSNTVSDWEYYCSESAGKGKFGDDIIWSLVDWPSLKPKDSFRVVGAIGLENAIYESQARLEGRWQILHDPDDLGIGFVPARGIKSKLRRAAAKVLHVLGSL